MTIDEKHQRAEEAILDLIAEYSERKSPAHVIKDLAEAWSWLRAPNNSHGGGVKLKS